MLIKQRAVLFLFIILAGNMLHAQTRLHEVYPLDTIIYLNDDFEAFQASSLKMTIENNCLYVSRITHKEKQSDIKLACINLSTRQTTYSTFTLKGKKFKPFKRSGIDALFVDGDDIIFCMSVYRKNYLIRCSLVTGSVIAVTIFEKEIGLAKTHVNNAFYYAYCYNAFDPVMPHSKSYIGIADKSGKILQNKDLSIPGIEFSHFEPRHWIDALPGKALVAQTLWYELTIYDSAFAGSDKIRRTIPGWKQMDTVTLNEITSSIPGFQAKRLIEALEPYHNGRISRVDGGWLINDTSVLVRYYMPLKTPDFLKYTYYFDLWVKSNDRWELEYKDLTDTDEDWQEDSAKLVTKTDIPVLSLFNPVCIKGNTIVSLWMKSRLLPYNKTLGQLKKEEAAYYRKEDPVLAVCIFKRKE